MSVLTCYFAVLETLWDVLAYFRLFNCRIGDSVVSIDCYFAVLETLLSVLADFRLFNCRIRDSDVCIGTSQTVKLLY